MADVQPLHALHYDARPRRRPAARRRAALRRDRRRAARRAWPPARRTTSSRSTCREADGDLDPYAHAADAVQRLEARGHPRPRPAAGAVGARAGLHGAGRQRATRARASSRACGSRTTAPAASARTSARTPGPKEDRLRLTRATRANLSPIFSLYDDPVGRGVERARAPHARASRGARSPTTTAPQHRSGASATAAPSPPRATRSPSTELLIADGHHRYETARVYADEIGGEGEHRYVLMCLVALQDPGLTVFPTHRLLTGLPDDKRAGAARGDPARLGDDRDRRRRPPADRRRRRPHRARLPRRAPPPPAPAHAQGPGDRRRRAAGHARALPPPRHRRARGADPQAARSA